EAGGLRRAGEWHAVTVQLVSGGQAGRSSSEDDHVLGRHCCATPLSLPRLRGRVRVGAATRSIQGAAANRIRVPASKRFAPAMSSGFVVCAARAKSLAYGGPIGKCGIASKQRRATPRTPSLAISLPHLRGKVKEGTLAISTHTRGNRITRRCSQLTADARGRSGRKVNP